MSTLTAVVLECPQCGAPVQQDSKTCNRCYSDYIVASVSSFRKLNDIENGVKKYLKAYESNLASNTDSPDIYTAIGLCHLQRRMYKYALTNFEKAISLLPSDGEAYYYAAISMLSGKRPFLSSLTVVKKATEYIDLAMELSDNGIYLYLKSLIYSDYYENKHLKCTPSSSELLSLAMKSGINDSEANDVKHLVGLI